MNRLLVEQGWEPVTNPLHRLQDLLGEYGAVKEAFAQRVDELRSLTTEDLLGRQDVAPLLSAYERALDRYGRLLTDAVRLGIEERAQALNEADARRLWKALDDGLIASVPAAILPDVRLALGAALQAQSNGEPIDIRPVIDTSSTVATPATLPQEPSESPQATDGRIRACDSA